MQLVKIFNTTKKITMQKYTLPFLSLCLIAFAGCKTTTNEIITSDEPYCVPKELKEGLNFEKVTKRPIEKSITLNGTIEYNKDKTIPYISLVDGIVTKTNFSLGDYVQKGQILVEISSTDLNELHEDFNSAQKELKVAKRELESVKQMYDDGIASQKELLEAESEVKVLESKVQLSKNNLKHYDSNSSGTYYIKAPQSGYIVTKDITTGMSINAGDDPLFTIADLSDVWIMANVYATNMKNVTPNLEVQVSTLAYPDEYFAGKISKISQVFDSEERVLKAQITMVNQEMKLKPGMAADIVIQLDSNEGDALAVPNNALIFDNNQNYVVVFIDDCHQEVRKVTPIAKNNLYTYVSDNVKEGEVVITTNELLIYDQLNNRL